MQSCLHRWCTFDGTDLCHGLKSWGRTSRIIKVTRQLCASARSSSCRNVSPAQVIQCQIAGYVVHAGPCTSAARCPSVRCVCRRSVHRRCICYAEHEHLREVWVAMQRCNEVRFAVYTYTAPNWWPKRNHNDVPCCGTVCATCTDHGVQGRICGGRLGAESLRLGRDGYAGARLCAAALPPESQRPRRFASTRSHPAPPAWGAHQLASDPELLPHKLFLIGTVSVAFVLHTVFPCQRRLQDFPVCRAVTSGLSRKEG